MHNSAPENRNLQISQHERLAEMNSMASEKFRRFLLAVLKSNSKVHLLLQAVLSIHIRFTCVDGILHHLMERDRYSPRNPKIFSWDSEQILREMPKETSTAWHKQNVLHDESLSRCQRQDVEHLYSNE